MNLDKLPAFIKAARHFLPSDDVGDAMYHDDENGQTYRRCCDAEFHFYPHNQAPDCNQHNPGCPAMKLAAALAELESD